jgi:hypothetical protein
MNQRIMMIEHAMNLLLKGKGGNSLEILEPSANDFLKIAFKEDSPLGPYGMCGFPCDGSCDTCDTQTKRIAEYFASVVLTEEEKKEDEEWEEQERRNREIDEINQAAAQELVENLCASCGNECISYEQDGQVNWICEECYNGNQPVEIGHCGFPCDGHCRECGGLGTYDSWDEI